MYVFLGMYFNLEETNEASEKGLFRSFRRLQFGSFVLLFYCFAFEHAYVACISFQLEFCQRHSRTVVWWMSTC